MCDITYAWLREFSQNYGHLAHADDLHLHLHSFFLALTTMSSEVPNYLLSLCLIHASLTSHAIHFAGIQIHLEEKGGYLFILDPSDALAERQ